MKILMIGNSLIGCLLEAYRPEHYLVGNEVAFNVVPGADGPDFVIEEDQLRPREPERFPHNRPFCWPADAWRAVLQDQDALVIGTLAFMDDPKFPEASLLGSFCMPSFGVRRDLADPPPPVTRAVATACLRGQWSKQPGVVFSSTLRQVYAGRMLVLPYPALAQSSVQNPSSLLGRIYEHPQDVVYFFESQRQAWLKEWCVAKGMDMLDYQAPSPDSPWTPDNCLAADRFHMAAPLSREIWNRIDCWVKSSGDVCLKKSHL